MEETQWIDWHPQVGDIKPDLYRVKDKKESRWSIGEEQGQRVSHGDFKYCDYQIPAPVVTPPEDRPPWIDPQCKFRWGDRVKVTAASRVGAVAYIINPHDTSKADSEASGYTVLVGSSLSNAVPYETTGSLHKQGKWFPDYSLDRLREDQLELFPEDFPQHFDDRTLDADQPQEQPKTARVPREVWVNRNDAGVYGYAWDTQLGAERSADDDCETIHFREVLSDDLSNIQYSPGG